MNNMQKQVQEFHEAMELPVADVAAGPKVLDRARADLRAKLIQEEAGETSDALEWHDFPRVAMPEIVDGLCDLLYVTFGCAVEMGIDLEPFFNEVHAANMRKVGGEVRADGKKLKPKGWVGPAIGKLLQEAGW